MLSEILMHHLNSKSVFLYFIEIKLDLFQRIGIEYCQRKLLDEMYQILCLGKSL